MARPWKPKLKILGDCWLYQTYLQAKSTNIRSTKIQSTHSHIMKVKYHFIVFIETYNHSKFLQNSFLKVIIKIIIRKWYSLVLNQGTEGEKRRKQRKERWREKSCFSPKSVQLKLLSHTWRPAARAKRRAWYRIDSIIYLIPIHFLVSSARNTC